MKQNILKLGLIILYVLMLSPLCFATTYGAATKYEVKMHQVEVYNSGTKEWVTVYHDAANSLAIDVAAGTAGTSAGVFAAGLTIPDGVYTKCRVTPATTFRIKGDIGTWHTTATTHPDGTVPPPERTASLASESGSAADCDVVILESDLSTVAAQTNVFSTPITVTNGNADHQIRVNFDVSATLGLHDHDLIKIILPEPPTVSVAVVDD